MILRCPETESVCQYFSGEAAAPAHMKLVGMYLDKYSENGFVLIPDDHFQKLSDKLKIEHNSTYIATLFKSWGWYQIRKGEDVEDGILMTNIHTKEMGKERDATFGTARRGMEETA
jgi:hypothetical protein